jgi:hypothetical protein
LADGLNVYNYVGGDPVSKSDKTGTQGDPANETPRSVYHNKGLIEIMMADPDLKEAHHTSGEPAQDETPQQRQRRTELEVKYGISIHKGQREWSDTDIDELEFSLSKLSKKELDALKGWEFVRDDFNREHQGITLPDKKQIRIQFTSIEDTRRTEQNQTSKSDEGGLRYEHKVTTLHEIDHALAYHDYDVADLHYAEMVKRYNDATPTEQLKLARVGAVASAERERDAIYPIRPTVNVPKPEDYTRAEHEFEQLSKGLDPARGGHALSQHAAENAKEGFAETFAHYKLCERVPGMSPELADWFSKQKYIKNP